MSELKDCFDRDGFVFCEAFASEQLTGILDNLERVLSELVPAMPAEYVYYEDMADLTSLKQLQLLNEHDAWFGKLANDGAFPKLAEQLFGEPAICKNVQYFNKPPKIGKPTPAHQDGFYFKLDPPNALTMWLALEPVDLENGCVRYVPGSHQVPMRQHRSTGTLGFSQGIVDFPNESDQISEVAVPAMPGDLLAHHSMTIHRADGNQSDTRTRRALGFIYYGESAKQDLEGWQEYQSELKDKLVREKKI